MVTTTTVTLFTLKEEEEEEEDKEDKKNHHHGEKNDDARDDFDDVSLYTIAKSPNRLASSSTRTNSANARKTTKAPGDWTKSLERSNGRTTWRVFEETPG